MKTIEIAVRFEGVVRVSCPDHLSDADAKLLAKKIAVARMLATTENADCGECLEEACEEFINETNGNGTVKDFDAATTAGVSGQWHA